MAVCLEVRAVTRTEVVLQVFEGYQVVSTRVEKLVADLGVGQEVGHTEVEIQGNKGEVQEDHV